MSNIQVKKFKNGNILLNPDGGMTAEELYYHDSLFWKDLRFMSFDDPWEYLVDDNSGKVYMITDYHFNHFETLLRGKAVRLVPCGDIGTEDYPEDRVLL